MIPARVRSILVIRFQRLGDLIIVMTLLQNLRAAYPQARITLMCQDVYSDFLRHQPGVDDTIPIPRKRGLGGQLRGWYRALRLLTSQSFDLVIDVSDNRRSSQLTRLTRAPLRIGFWPPARPSRGVLEKGAYNLFAAHPVTGDDRNGHFVANYLTPLQALGVPVSVSRPTLTATESDRRTVDTLLNQLDLGSFAVIHPGARTSDRRWPADRYPPVMAHLVKRDLAIVMVGEAAERAIADDIASMAPSAFTDLVGRLSLGELTALLERCRLFIGNNTGPIHMAAAVGARIVAIYGLQSVLWAPLGDHVMVTPPRPCACVDPAVCRPHDPDGSLCVRNNAVADVVAAIDRQLASAAAPQAP